MKKRDGELLLLEMSLSANPKRGRKKDKKMISSRMTRESSERERESGKALISLIPSNHRHLDSSLSAVVLLFFCFSLSLSPKIGQKSESSPSLCLAAECLSLSFSLTH